MGDLEYMYTLSERSGILTRESRNIFFIVLCVVWDGIVEYGRAQEGTAQLLQSITVQRSTAQYSA